MKKMSFKTQRSIIVTGLIVLCLVLASVIYMVEKPNSRKDIISQENEGTSQVVAEINKSGSGQEDSDLLKDNEISNSNNTINVVVEPIDSEGFDSTGDSMIVEEVIEVSMPTEPKKPENTPPDHKPETTDDITDIEKEPQYNEEDTVYVPELKPIQVETPSEPSNLVPPSENPFLQNNIPSNGDGGEIKIDDVSDYVPGTGDKF